MTKLKVACVVCGLIGWDNFDEHFKVHSDGEDGCIHRKATIEKWYKEKLKSREKMAKTGNGGNK